MPKLNNKGISLIELLISIALISVVMMFMFKLLIDVTNEQSNDTYAKNNQINRSEIITRIESDFIDRDLILITDESEFHDRLEVIFSFSDGTQTKIDATTNTFTYGDIDSSGEFLEGFQKWTLTGCTLFTDHVSIYSKTDGSVTSPYFAIVIDIEVHTPNERNDVHNNNVLDDISLSYMGNHNVTYFPPCLGKSCEIANPTVINDL